MYFDSEASSIGSSPLGFVSSSGYFRYWAPDSHLAPHPSYNSSPSSPSSPSSFRSRRHKFHRRNKTCSLRRTMRYSPGEVLATLEFVAPLSDICHDWDPSEIKAGRRLVRFCSIQEGNRLIVSCGRITPDEYRPTDNVVSCIYREDVDDYFITSVDIIHLLQRLVGEDFAVMEKNRIRRNLEGLHPITVSKHRPGVDGFFQRIMDFPDPKPRNIEKDLKVFLWSLLPQALEKIVSKYSLYTIEQEDSPQPDFSPVYADPVATTETIPNEVPLISPISLDGCYNFIDSPTTTACSPIGIDYFNLFGGPSPIQESFSKTGSWVSDLNTDGSDGEPEFKTESPIYENVYDLTASTPFDVLDFQSLREHSKFSDFFPCSL